MTYSRRLAIRPLVRITIPRVMIYFDTESRQERSSDGRITTHRLWFGVASLWRRDAGLWVCVASYRFQSPGEFWGRVYGWVDGEPETYLLCHNAHFDWRMVDIARVNLHAPIYWHPSDTARELGRREQAEYAGQRVPLWSIQPRATFMTLHHRHGVIRCIDSLNYFPMSLGRLGESLGLHKLPMPAPDAPRVQWDDYCLRDVEIGARAVIRLWDTLQSRGLGGPAQTLAGTAMRVWRTSCLREPLLLPDRPGLRETHRQAYYGGHVDVAYLGQYDGQVWVVDVRSLYPYVMSTRKYPTEWLRRVDHPPIGALRDYMRRYSILGRVRLYSPDRTYPLRLHGRVRYVRGHLDTWLSAPELEHALTAGHVVSCTEAHLFRRSDLFSEYVRRLYTLREHAISNDDSASSLIYKLLLNSLYGKFGQRGIDHEYKYDPDGLDDAWSESHVRADGSPREVLERFGPLLRRARDAGEAAYSHPAIAAAVTSFGRNHMAAWKAVAGKGGWLYSDTDSLMLTGVGYCRWRAAGAEIGTALGQWSEEGPFAGVVIAGKKDYSLACRGCRRGVTSAGHPCSACRGTGWLRKIKGIRRDAQEISGPERERLLAEHGLGETSPHGLPVLTLRQALWHGLAGVWRDGWSDAVTVETVSKVMSRSYTDGYVSGGGWVEPLYLEPDDQAAYAADRSLWDTPPGTQPAQPDLVAGTTPAHHQSTG